ncbi:MAG: hypothetical protein U5O39_13760 [Gammaproteobacteria bacterium]|nr:hypothetical protein [Gammaproteobacteria bacterium]
MKRAIDSYLAERPDEPPLSTSVSEAEKVSQQTQQRCTGIEEKLYALQSKQEAAREARDEHRGDLQVKEEECRGLVMRIEEQKQQLEQAAATQSDEVLHERVNERLEKCTSLTDELASLEANLANASPLSVQEIFENTRAALRRAERDLQEAQQQCAVLEDRLAKAQADGRFEAFEHAGFRLEALEAEYAATLGRAAAAKRLWETISRHRDSARRAYVKPLKDGIEKLGKIVFGGDFEVELDDSWQLVSRTLAGKTISFDDLSVGAREQLGILTRLAAAGIVARKGGVPIIIDDALGFSDPGRPESMGTAIASAGKDCQVILLTCTPGRFMHVGNADVVPMW